jgi:hypothetical protein
MTLLLALLACTPASPPPQAPEAPAEKPAAPRCPEWRVENQMPTIDGAGPSHYYLLDGQRVEVDEAWVAANCPNVPVQTVQ